METLQSKIHPDELVMSSRGRVYLVWALLAPLGFVATHFNQMQNINRLWLAISIVGLGYMAKVMPLRVKQMRNIFLSWFVPITFGMIVSGAVFRIDSIGFLVEYLGVFWLGVMAAGYLSNGLYDRPAGWYWFAAAINVSAAVICLASIDALRMQYALAAIVTAWSMLNLWLFRTS